MENKYYFITVFNKFDDTYGIDTWRCWGFYDNFADANEVVTYNITDLWETIYHYALIEEYHQGISACTGHRWWYRYDQTNNMYEPIEEPECVKHYCSFAIG